MENKFPGAVTLGYVALFVSLWLFFMPFTGLIDFNSIESAQAELPVLMTLGGVILAVAGIFCFFGDNRVESVVFLIISAIIFSFSIRFTMFPNLRANTAPATVDGWVLVLIAVVIFYIWLVSLKGDSIKQFFLLGLWCTFLVGAVANWFSITILLYICGYLGLITALLAGWYSASTIMSKKNKSNVSQVE